jgi:hypothetical protein
MTGEDERSYRDIVDEGLTRGLDHDVQRVRFSPHRHAPLSPDVRSRLEEIRAALSEVHSLPLDAWEDGFRRDAHPEREIALWLHTARAYERLTTQRLGNLKPAHKHILFKVLLAAMSGRQRATDAARDLGLPATLRDIVFEEFYGKKP